MRHRQLLERFRNRSAPDPKEGLSIRKARNQLTSRRASMKPKETHVRAIRCRGGAAVRRAFCAWLRYLPYLQS